MTIEKPAPSLAADDRDALLAALGFKPGPLGDGLRRKVILDDAAALRPEMVKARRAARDAEATRDIYESIALDRPDGLVLRLWHALKVARRNASARATPTAAPGYEAQVKLWLDEAARIQRAHVESLPIGVAQIPVESPAADISIGRNA